MFGQAVALLPQIQELRGLLGQTLLRFVQPRFGHLPRLLRLAQRDLQRSLGLRQAAALGLDRGAFPPSNPVPKNALARIFALEWTGLESDFWTVPPEVNALGGQRLPK